MIHDRQTPSTAGKPKARILMLLENCAYSADGRVRSEADSLAAAGYLVTVIGPKRRGERWHETFGSVEAYQYPAPPEAGGVFGYLLEYGYSLAAAAVLSVWVALRRGFDVIHAHNPPDFFVLIAIAYRLFGKRFVFDQHDLSPELYEARFGGPGNPLVRRALLFFERLSCRWADCVVATNESYKQVQIERARIPASRITVVRNGPQSWHLKSYAADGRARDTTRTVIGYVGVMGYQDGVDYLLRALHMLKHDFGRTDWRGVLIGSGDALEDLQQTAAGLGIADELCFTGWIEFEKVPQCIGETDICVAPDPSTVYNDRSTIIKLMEYMAQARPVVAFDLPENRVTCGDTALYARPNDERDLAWQILRLMDDCALRERLGEAGRSRVCDHFTWERQAVHLLEAYRRLLGERVIRQPETGISTAKTRADGQSYERELCATD